MEKRVCIFCGKGGLTNEHVFPDWLSTLYGKTDGVSEVTKGEELIRSHPQVIFQQKAKMVCGDCNHGWLSTLEAQVKPFLGPMIQYGTRTKLYAKRQRLLSLWVAKTLLIAQKVTDSEVDNTDALAYIYAHKRVPENFHITIAYRRDSLIEKGALVATNRVIPINTMRVDVRLIKKIKDEIESGNGPYGSTLIIGHVAFQIIHSRLTTQGAVFEVTQPDETISYPIFQFEKQRWWPNVRSIEEIGGIVPFHNALAGTEW